MIAEGVLDAAGRPVTSAFALHVRSQGSPRGQFAARPGPMMGGAEHLTVVVRGAGGHAAFPHLTRDPLTVAAEIMLALQIHVTRRFDVFDPVVVTVGAIHAGTAANIIPTEARLEATVRTFSAQTQKRATAEFARLCEGIAMAHGLSVEILRGDEEYPVTVNDADQYEFAAATVTDALGPDRFFRLAQPVAAAEDFSYVLRTVPGCYLVLGALAGDDPATAPANHSPHAVFDDAVLADGALIYTELAIRALASQTSRGDGA